MGDSNSTYKTIDYESLSRQVKTSCALLLAIFIPQKVHSEDTQSISKISAAYSQRHYRLPNDDRPRLGTIISPEEVAEAGGNFRFCDETVADVDLDKLVVSRTTCEGDKSGPLTAMFANNGFNDLVGTKVYDEKGQLVGEITDNFSVIDATSSDGVPSLEIEIRYGSPPTPLAIDVESPYLDFQESRDGIITGILRGLPPGS